MEKVAPNDQVDRKLTAVDCLPLPRGYSHVYDHYFQTSPSLKLRGQSKQNLMWSLHGKEWGCININGLSHMTKMAAMVKTFKYLI